MIIDTRYWVGIFDYLWLRQKHISTIQRPSDVCHLPPGYCSAQDVRVRSCQTTKEYEGMQYNHH